MAPRSAGRLILFARSCWGETWSWVFCILPLMPVWCLVPKVEERMLCWLGGTWVDHDWGEVYENEMRRCQETSGSGVSFSTMLSWFHGSRCRISLTSSMRFVGFIADWQVFFSGAFEAAGLVSFSPVAVHANITVSLSFALLPSLQEMSLVLRVLSRRALYSTEWRSVNVIVYMLKVGYI